jgi:hypothetical protein
MTVRDINRHLLTCKPVVAVYIVDGREKQGRIRSARTRHGIVEVKIIGAGRWAALKSDESVWIA